MNLTQLKQLKQFNAKRIDNNFVDNKLIIDNFEKKLKNENILILEKNRIPI